MDGEDKKINCYVCEEKQHKTWTLHRDAGVTPFMVGCRHDGCESMAQSSFYRVDQNAAVWQGPFVVFHPALKERGDVLAVWIVPDDAELAKELEDQWAEAESYCREQIDGPDEPMLGGDTLESMGITTARAYFDRFLAKQTREHCANGGCLLVSVDR